MSLLQHDQDYSAFLHELKTRIKSVQIKAAVSVNRELIALYWELAEKIVEKQKNSQSGDGLLVQGPAGRVSGHEGFFAEKPEVYASVISVLV